MTEELNKTVDRSNEYALLWDLLQALQDRKLTTQEAAKEIWQMIEDYRPKKERS